MAELHRGRIAKAPRVLTVRPIVREDLPVLKERRVGPPRIKALRETHHRVARLIASGLRDHEIALATGYSPNRLGQFRGDPAMQELIAQYRERIDESWIKAHDHFHQEMVEMKIRTFGMIREQMDQAEDSGEALPLKVLIPFMQDLADRTGHGKHSSQTVEHRNFAAEMKEIARRSGRSNVIDARPISPGTVSSAPGDVTSAPLSPEQPSAEGPAGFPRRM